MKLPVQTLIPGSLEKAYHREFQNLVAAEAVVLLVVGAFLSYEGYSRNQAVNL